jgi:hypothetical protein
VTNYSTTHEHEQPRSQKKTDKISRPRDHQCAMDREMVWQQHLQDLATQTCLSKPDDTERRIGHSAPKS